MSWLPNKLELICAEHMSNNVSFHFNYTKCEHFHAALCKEIQIFSFSQAVLNLTASFCVNKESTYCTPRPGFETNFLKPTLVFPGESSAVLPFPSRLPLLCLRDKKIFLRSRSVDIGLEV